MRAYSHYSPTKTSALVGIPSAPPAPAPAITRPLPDPMFSSNRSAIGDLSFATANPQDLARQQLANMILQQAAAPQRPPLPPIQFPPLSSIVPPPVGIGSIVSPEAQARMLADTQAAMKDPAGAIFPHDAEAAKELRENMAAADVQQKAEREAKEKADADAAAAKAKADADAAAAKAKADEENSYFNQAKRLIANHPMAAQFALYGGGGALAGGALAAALSSKKNRIRNALLGGLLGGGLGALGRYYAYKNEAPHINASGKGLEDAFGNPVAPRTFSEGMGVGMSNYHP